MLLTLRMSDVFQHILSPQLLSDQHPVCEVTIGASAAPVCIDESEICSYCLFVICRFFRTHVSVQMKFGYERRKTTIWHLTELSTWYFVRDIKQVCPWWTKRFTTRKLHDKLLSLECKKTDLVCIWKVG